MTREESKKTKKNQRVATLLHVGEHETEAVANNADAKEREEAGKELGAVGQWPDVAVADLVWCGKGFGRSEESLDWHYGG